MLQLKSMLLHHAVQINWNQMNIIQNELNIVTNLHDVAVVPANISSLTYFHL